MAEQCMNFGAKVLLIKCGAKGMYYRTADRIALLDVGKKAELDILGWSGKELSLIHIYTGSVIVYRCLYRFHTSVLCMQPGQI